MVLALLPRLLAASFAAGILFAPASSPGQTAQRPNVVLVLTDNQGAWSLGCYGNRDVRTPHIDRLAKEGALFTRAHANNAVCSPTRASLLTGLMPSQHGVHTFLNDGGAQTGPRAYNTVAEFETLPRLLARAGYVTGLVGKWHLGGNLEPQEGFSTWVTMPTGAAGGFHDQEVVDGGRIRRQPGYLTDFWTDQGVRFIERNKAQPFFLFLAYNGPYGLRGTMKEKLPNRHSKFYRDKELPSFPRDAPHPWNRHYGAWLNDIEVRRQYAAEVSGIDDGVGRIMATLRRLGLDDETLVVFTADQGLAGGHSGFWGMGDHTTPLTAFDWTTWIPLVFRQPGRIAGGRRLDPLVSTYDMLPTLLAYLGLEEKLPNAPALPGRSFAATLEGRTIPWDDTVFFELENVRSIRTAKWKYIERIHEAPNELYDLERDPGERLNQIARPDLEPVRKDLRERLHRFFQRYADPKWDLWKGGRSKADLLTGSLFGNPQPYFP